MFFNTLSGRFLGLTILFVVIAEVLIFVPAVARFRVDNLQNRLELAQLAALAQLAIPENENFVEEDAASEDGEPPELDLQGLDQQLLVTADVLNVVLRRKGVRELVLESDMPMDATETFDLSADSNFKLMKDALQVFVTPKNRVIRVIGRPQRGDSGEIEVTLREAPLRTAMIAYGLRILYLSLAISAATAALLFFAVRFYIVRPMKRVVAHMIAYRDAPEDASRVIAPENSVRELREAEVALQDLQVRLTGALRQKDRLAALGGAVAKISHDLRNLLTTAQLLADRIDASADPAVRRTAPKLVHSLSRAITLCERTLTYGRAEETPPDLVPVALGPLIDEVVENEAAATEGRVPIRAEVAPWLEVRADADQLFRVLTNLVRNAVQAIEAGGRPGAVTVGAILGEDRVEIRVADNGPGLPAKAQENLFQPFRGGARQGGAGLGLVIAAELVRGHGGTLTMERTGPGGSCFLICLPRRA